VDSETRYFITYPCPKCKTELEVEHGGWQGWLRCPVCGVASLPPEFLLGHPLTRRHVVDPDESGAATTADEAESAVTDPARLTRPAPTSALRLIFLTGLTLSLFLLLIAFIDQKKQTTAIFGFLSITFFLLLLRTPRNRAVSEE
jgi:hypothetical protein